MIKMEEFGYCLEEYVYSVNKNKVDAISYTRYDEIGGEVAVIGVHNDGRNYKKSIILWPNVDKNLDDSGYINKDIDEMKLYLNETDNIYDTKNVTVHTYGSAIRKDDDEFEIVVEGYDGEEISIFVDKCNVAVYDSEQKLFKIYSTYRNGKIDYNDLIEKIKVTKFGYVTETISEKDGSIFAISNNKLKVYCYTKTDTPIESLAYQCTELRDVHRNDRLYKISYDNDGMVESVVCNKEIFSRNEAIDIIVNSNYKYAVDKTVIYPTLITENYQNYEYQFMRLWTHDSMRKDAYDNIIFVRKIYVIRNSQELIRILRENLDQQLIEY